MSLADTFKTLKQHASAVALSVAVGVGGAAIPFAQAQAADAQTAVVAPQVKTADLKGETALFLAEAPIAASHGRVAIFVRSEDKNLLRAAYKAAKAYSSENGGAQTYMLYAGDNDTDPSTAEVGFYAGGLPFSTLTITNAQDYAEIEATITAGMHKAYDKLLAGNAKVAVADLER